MKFDLANQMIMLFRNMLLVRKVLGPHCEEIISRHVTHRFSSLSTISIVAVDLRSRRNLSAA